MPARIACTRLLKIRERRSPSALCHYIAYAVRAGTRSLLPRSVGTVRRRVTSRPFIRRGSGAFGARIAIGSAVISLVTSGALSCTGAVIGRLTLGSVAV